MLKTIILIITWLIIASYALAGLSAAPWVPTKPRQIKHLVKDLDLSGKKIFYDLGCGSGTVAFALAAKYPALKIIGVDISLLPLAIAWLKKIFHPKKYKNVHIRFANLFKTSVKDADAIFVFLLAKCYPSLIKKFACELQDEALIIVEAWPLPRIDSQKTIRLGSLLPIFIYQGSQFKKLL